MTAHKLRGVVATLLRGAELLEARAATEAHPGARWALVGEAKDWRRLAAHFDPDRQIRGEP